MAIRKTVFDAVTNKEQEGTVIDIVPAKEPMMSLSLADGTEVRIKNTIMEVVKFDHTNDKGEPIYNFAADVKVQVYLPKEQKNNARRTH